MSSWSGAEQRRMVMCSAAGWSGAEQRRMVRCRAAQGGQVQRSAGWSGAHINLLTVYLVMVLPLPAIILPDIKYLRKD